MKRKYVTPQIKKVTFDYERVVATSVSCEMLDIFRLEAVKPGFPRCHDYWQDTPVSTFSLENCVRYYQDY